MSNSAPYLFYTVSLIALGTLLNEVSLNMFDMTQVEETTTDQMNHRENEEINKFLDELKNQ